MAREIATEYYKSIEDQRKKKSHPISAFIYGKAGTGKTRFLGTFPKPFVLDTDQGLLTITGEDVKSFSFTSEMDIYGTMLGIIQDIKHKQGPFAEGGALSDRKTIAVDSMSVTASNMFATIVETNKKDTRAAYQILLSQLTTLTALFRELKLYGYNVVMTAGEAIKANDATGISEPAPLIPGSFRDFIAHQFDQSLWFEVVVRNGKPTYNAYSLAEKGHAAKERIGLPGKVENLSFDLMRKTLDAKFDKKD